MKKTMILMIIACLTLLLFSCVKDTPADGSTELDFDETDPGTAQMLRTMNTLTLFQK